MYMFLHIIPSILIFQKSDKKNIRQNDIYDFIRKMGRHIRVIIRGKGGNTKDIETYWGTVEFLQNQNFPFLNSFSKNDFFCFYVYYILLLFIK